MMTYYLERLNDLYIYIYVVYTDISKWGITVKYRYIVVARVYVCVLEKERDRERDHFDRFSLQYTVLKRVYTSE